MEDLHLSKLEQKQYNRHIILEGIGFEGQLKLKKAKVLVVGAGGLGSPVLQYLTAAGVGTVGISDNDTIDISNIARQVMYAKSEIGMQKAIVAAKRLEKLNPNCKINIHNIFLKDERVLKIIDDYDIIVDATDNIPARYLLNDACIIKNKILVHASLFKFQGLVSVFNYKKGPSYRCLFPFPPRSEKLLESASSGIIGALVGIIGAIQASEVIKIITEIGQVLSGELLIYNFLDHSSHKYQLHRQEKNFEIDELIDYEEYCKPSI